MEESKSPWTEMMREMALSGLATLFMTEDVIRNQLKDLKLPKELIGTILEGMSKKKEDLYSVFGREFAKVLSKIDLSSEMARFLETHRVTIELSFQPKEDKR